MKNKKSPGLRKGLATGLAAALGVGLGGVAGAGTASADPVTLDLKYECTYPLIGKRSLDLHVRTDIPKKIQAGTAIPKIQIFWDAGLGADTTEGLQAVDGVKIGGLATAKARVEAPDFPNGLDVNVRNQLKNTEIPGEGGFTIPGYGEATGPQFTAPGHGKVTLGDLALKVTVLKSDGGSSALGTFDAPCTLTPGQNNTVTEFDVTNDPVTYPPAQNPPAWYPEKTPATADPGTLNYAFGLKGSSFIKNANGTVPLDGDIKVRVDGRTGAITGDLLLKKTSGQMNILGFLPVTATVDFEQVGQTVGTYTGGEIATRSTMNIKMPNFQAFGVIPIGGGDNCKTTQPSTVALGSKTGAFFNPKKGGALSTKDYSIASIKDCGPLEGIISLFAAGSGNTIDLNLTPRS
ncbi:DUF6801 domain-containing protein [Actinomadura miaoliensis]|uniref:DUF6801 domain-containing protein n=1 Tax=Actinomadura miaoliensis TaxID=430685 RepID=A0ABP7UVZ7_9ACTN